MRRRGKLIHPRKPPPRHLRTTPRTFPKGPGHFYSLQESEFDFCRTRDRLPG
ncbi:hypothetical protein HMPREF3038_00793 [Akkermansia sp. KLE1797]|nr:hypothetical protein HMPREF3038_00793 [Akkermansia sp. KLE1797]KXU54552.1 hypothetical protein HMPREF3039_01449 [Akkermansia sp. KLE1798]KZA04945.1 hypothetical protein HMPREF1326_01527 [Akkermansia sp. KLE1605]